MNQNNRNRALKSLKVTIIIVAIICVVLIAVSVILMIWFPDKDIFSTAVSNGQQINIPFTIFIEVLATTSGIVLGLQIDNYVDEKRGHDSYKELLLRIVKFIDNLVAGTSEEALNTVYDLAQFKMHWDLLLQADAFSVQSLQNNKYYFDLAYVFNFLHFNEKYWAAHQEKTIGTLKKERFTVNTKFLDDLENWVNKVGNLQKNLQTILRVEDNNIDWDATSKKLKEIRTTGLNLNEESLAKKFKVSKKLIKKWEDNKCNPAIEQLIKYSELCEKELFEIVILKE